MCGFIAAFPKLGRNLESFHEDVGTILRHRGPDHTAILKRNGALFVHNRLAIIDLHERANQPFISSPTGNVLLFNGEIYNFKALKNTHNDILWETESDTEVVIRLFEKMGPGFVNELNGIFAFVIFVPGENKLYCYRDRVGVKPLYYGVQDSMLCVASEMKGILPFMKERRLNYRVVHDYLELGLLQHNTSTFLEGIEAVSPGTYLEIDLNSFSHQTRRYWDLHSGTSVPRSEEEWVEKAASLLTDAVKLNLVSDVEIAVSLSSGTDSTLLLCILREHSEKQLRCFTFAFEDEEYDESWRVRENDVLKSVPMEPVFLRPGDMLSRLKEAVHYFETPLGGLPTLALYNMMSTVRTRGIKVILSGEGADEVFGGYRYYYPAFFKDIQANGSLLQKELSAYNRVHQDSLRYPSLEYDAWQQSVTSTQVFASDGTGLKSGYVSPYLETEAKRFSATSYHNGHAPQPSALRTVMTQDLRVKRIPKLLHFQDRCSMAHGVETRVPYLDHRVIELMHSAPLPLLIRNGRTKYVLRRILEDRYGIRFHNRVKHYMLSPQREWLKGPVYKEIVGLLRGGLLERSGLVEMGLFFSDYEKYRHATALGNSFFVWQMVNLEYLLQEWRPQY